MNKQIFFIILSIFIISCSDEVNPESETFLKVRKKIVEEYDSNKIIGKETVFYTYASKTDYFWETAKKTNTLYNDTILIKRHFDKELGTPIKEVIYSNNKAVGFRITSYSKYNFELLSSFEYNIKNNDTILISKIERTYNKGYLISEKYELYSEEFKNINGSNLIKAYKLRNLQPFYFLPKGYFIFSEFFEYYLEYQTDQNSANYGDTLKYLHTNYDKNGLPKDVLSKIYNIDKKKLQTKCQWLVNELNEDSVLVSITAYENKKRDSINEDSYKIFFIKDDNLISEVQKYFYNNEDKDFNKFNEMKIYEWLIPEYYSRYNFTDYNYSDELYNYADSIHSYSEKKITRWDDVGLKVIEFKADSYIGEYESQDFEPKLKKRITYVFDKVEKIGPKVVFKRNKKY